MHEALIGDVVQITKEKNRWFPCLVIVTEIKSFGIEGCALIPRNDGMPTEHAYVRLDRSHYEVIGPAKVTPE